jgi:transglutaminase-like putative cysteine protease
MTPQVALRLSAYLLVVDGVVALYLAGLVGPVALSVVTGALGLAWWRAAGTGPRPAGGQQPGAGGGRFTLGMRLDRVFVLGVAAAATVHLVYVADSPLDAFVYLLLLLVLLRLFTARSLGDVRDAALLSFFMLVAAASVAFGVSLLFVFVGFLALATWMLMLHHVVSESERADQDPATPGLFRLSVAGSLVAIAITSALFFVIPRVGQASLPIRAELRRMITGFTSHVELGAIGEIETDATVVMRVSLPDAGPAAAELPGLRWRGITLDQFDGRGWIASRPERRALRAVAPGLVRVSAPRGGGRILTQEIFLEPIGTDVIFAVPRVLTVRLASAGLLVDEAGGLSVTAPAARLRYTVESELGPAAGGPGIAGRPLDAAARERYLQLPPLPERVRALARRAGAGGEDAGAAARRLTEFLRREYRYSLVQTRTPNTDALEDFLFVRRSGNCEYFATALAVMLRAVGVPARIVNGFQRGEWNPYGEYFAVRLSDAHSWVEAWIDGVGWTGFDPSPRGEPPAPAWGHLGLYLDALRMHWYRYVVNWSLKDQVDLAAAIRQRARSWRPGWDGFGGWEGSRGVWLVGLGVLLVGVTAWAIGRGGAVGRRREPGRAVPGFYRRALRTLARQGVRPGRHETAREFCERVQAARPPWRGAIGALTLAYERVRFGGASLTPDDHEALEGCLAALRGGGR